MTGSFETPNRAGGVRDDDGVTTRPYRIRKRRRPCDQCRSRKLRCQAQGKHLPCSRCDESQTACTFQGTPARRTPGQNALSSPAGIVSVSTTPLNNHILDHNNEHPHDSTSTFHSPGAPIRSSVAPSAPRHEEDQLPIARQTNFPPMAQFSQTLDGMTGQTAVLLGASSESDPWLLRHCRFDEYGLKSFYGFQIRNVGGVPLTDRIPVHFIVTPNAIHDLAATDTKVKDATVLRVELDELIPAEWGVRLVRLFYKHVFPLLPITSTKYFEAQTPEGLPPVGSLQHIPCHLLAAMYGHAMPFSRNDDYMAIRELYGQLPYEKIWRICYDCLQEEIHRPHLSTLQAGILYLHKNVNTVSTSPDTFKWSWLGTLVGITQNLGLHLETRMCAIPLEERQIRRRLWWAVYIEDKWLSLLMGRPPYIHPEEWDVGALDDDDFTVPEIVPNTGVGFAKLALPFREMTRLAMIAQSVQSSLYSLRVSQNLSQDLSSSLEMAKAVFDELGSWRASMQSPDPLWTATEHGGDHENDHPVLFTAYVTLVGYVWRALLRPTVLTTPPPIVVDNDNPLDATTSISPQAVSLENLDWELPDLADLQLLQDNENEDTAVMIQELYQASLSWGANMVSLTKGLTTGNFSAFWPSWSSRCFSLMSNFLVVIHVQSPTPELAVRSKEMLDTWRQVILAQSKVSPLLLPALGRLNSFFVAGLAEVFAPTATAQSF